MSQNNNIKHIRITECVFVAILWSFFEVQFLRCHARDCYVIKTEYTSSSIEKDTFTKVFDWENYYCKTFGKDAYSRNELLKATSDAGISANAAMDEKWSHSLSFFKSSLNCSGRLIEQTRSIEPLYSILRHPNAILCPSESRSKAVMNINHLVLEDVHNLAIKHAHQKIYIDLGASSFSSLSQSRLLKKYEKRGIYFHRHLLWEARPGLRWEEIPGRFLHAYQYFSFPVSSDPQSARNPLNILKRIASPSDFVVLKLDIDNPVLEKELVQQILLDQSLSSLLDEFFFEPHFNFAPMIRCCWRTDGYDEQLGLNETLDIFLRLRKRGVRAHGWP